MKTYQKILISVGAVFLSLLLGFFVFYLCVTSGDNLDDEKLRFSLRSVRVLDKDGKELQIHSSKTVQTVSIEGLKPATKYAFVDTEDKRFYTHDGFDYRRILKAALTNLKRGSFSQGASTISQQLVKNTHLTQEKTLKRKLREFKLTKQLEKRYQKERILEKYLNTIYFGHSCFGISSASEFYFDKPPADLTISESAILAGLVRSPNNYSPFKNPDACKKRRNLVLSLMKQQGHLTDEEYQKALLEPLPTQSETDAYSSERFLSETIDELENIFSVLGYTLSGDITVYTAFDKDLQEKLEKLSLDRSTDLILSVLDRESMLYKGYFGSVKAIKRLPGSLLKPLLVYAPAMEEGNLVPATPILDEKTDFSGYTPQNYNDVYHGYVSAREALSKSLNVPAVKVLSGTGVKKSISYLSKMGLPVQEEDCTLALALGGMKEGFSLKDLQCGYATLCNGGIFQKGSFISKIDLSKKTIYEKPKEKTRVFSKETAYLTTDVLKTATSEGTAKKLRSLPFPIAAKTGTAGSVKTNTDAYCLTYTTKDVVGVWLGNANGSSINELGGGQPTNLAYHINEYLYNDYTSKGVEITDFKKPKNVTFVSIDKREYLKSQKLLLADPLCPIDEKFQELFPKALLPRKSSTTYSNPTVLPPTVSLESGKVILSVEKTDLYDFIIEREDEKEKKTVFSGRLNGTFTDFSIEKGKTYIYTVTPVYMNKKGTPVKSKKLTTKGLDSTQNKPPEILDKDWWKE